MQLPCQGARLGAACRGRPTAQLRQAPIALATPARRTNNAGNNSYLNFSDYDAVGDDMNLIDAKTRLQFDDFVRTDGPAFTPTNRRRTGGNNTMAWNRYDDSLYGNFGEDEYDEEYMDEYLQAKPATLSDEKRFLNGKQILTNYDITAPLLRVIGEKREQIGMKTRDDALQMALEQEVDLILINPNEAPPVARLMEWSKFKFEIEMGEKKQSKKAKAVVVETKEVRLSPKTDDHDLATKIKATQKFLDKGNKVKLVMKFEGRQLQHKDQGKEVLLKFITDLGEGAKVEGPLSFKGATYQVTLTPGKASAASSSGKGDGKEATASAAPAAAPAPPAASAPPAGPHSAAPPSTAPAAGPGPAAPAPPARPPMPPSPVAPMRPGGMPPPLPPAPPRPAGGPGALPPPPMRMPPPLPQQPLRPPPGPVMQPAGRPQQPVSTRQP